jgi:HSP20 family protein
VPIEVKETDKQLTVHAEVPGFKAEEIKVSVEPQRLIISGESKSETEQKTEQTVFNERRSRQFCRSIELPAEVEPQRTTATLNDGVLELTLDKIERAPATNVEVKTL